MLSINLRTHTKAFTQVPLSPDSTLRSVIWMCTVMLFPLAPSSIHWLHSTLRKDLLREASTPDENAPGGNTLRKQHVIQTESDIEHNNNIFHLKLFGSLTVGRSHWEETAGQTQYYDYNIGCYSFKTVRVRVSVMNLVWLLMLVWFCSDPL